MYPAYGTEERSALRWDPSLPTPFAPGVRQPDALDIRVY